MPLIKNPDHPDQIICQNLRTKANYVPDMQNEHYMEVHHPYNCYFCLVTLDAIGPDDCPVSSEDCTSERACYKPLVGSLPA